MSTTTHLRGNKIELINNQWIYTDDKLPVDIENERPCIRCGKESTKEGYDYCLGDLPGVEFACCGHGEEEGYIKFKNGVLIRGWFRVCDY